MLKLKLFTALVLALPLAFNAQGFSEDKCYVISNFAVSERYMTETGSLTWGDVGRNALWRFIPTENTDCYYIQSVATGKYIQSSSTGQDKSVATGYEKMEFHVVNDPAKGNDIYGFASTDQSDYGFSGATLGLNANDGGYVACFTAQIGANPKSFWKITESSDTYPTDVTSPYKGSVPEAGQSYYLYQVETGRWLQENMTDKDKWTTHAEIGEIGFDVELRKLEGFERGFQIYCRYTNNGELNGSDEDRCYLDQGDRAECEWIFEPVEIDGVVNGYRLFIDAKDGEGVRDRDRIRRGVYLGAVDGGRFGGLAPSQDQERAARYTTWQLVTREERFKVETAGASGENPVDVTWLIPYSVLGRQDKRDELWKNEWRNTLNDNMDDGAGFGPSSGYPVQERWDHWTGYREIELTDLPDGTYGFSLQAYYRDSSIDDANIANRHRNGTEVLDRVKYYVGTTQANVMSIFDGAVDHEGFGDNRRKFEGIGYVPNNLYTAQEYMLNGQYVNPFIISPVTGGTLTVGLNKNSVNGGDWLVYKRFYLRYYGDDTSAATQEQLKNLREIYNECLNLKAGQFADIYYSEELSLTKFDAAIALAKEVLDTEKPDADQINSAATALSNAYNLVTAAGENIMTFWQIYNLICIEQDEELAEENNLILRGPIDDTAYIDTFNNAGSTGDYANALNKIKYARRVNNAVQHKDSFEHQPVAAGKFYIYNVGRKMFLSGGSDWGAHAALGNPGVEVTLEDAGNGAYVIETGLYNGENNHYLGKTGYMDTGEKEPYRFEAVEGEGLKNVYNIVHDFNNTKCFVKWDPYARVDAGNGNEFTVGVEQPADPDDPDAQWILVTRQERLAMAENASEIDPVDLTFLISRPGFNQRESFSTFFFNEGFEIWKQGENHSDFAFESWNGAEGVNFSHQLEDIPLGVYKVCVQGFYRNGHHETQPDADKAQNAVLFAGNNETPLLNITYHDNQAPSDGRDAVAQDGTTYHYPYDIPQSTVWFRTGLFNNYVTATVRNGYTLPIGVEKTAKGEDGDWIVVDNIRLYYYGPDADEEKVALAADPITFVKTGSSAIEDVVGDMTEAADTPADNVIYNLQGIRVAHPSVPGIYIVNGKKVLIK